MKLSKLYQIVVAAAVVAAAAAPASAQFTATVIPPKAKPGKGDAVTAQNDSTIRSRQDTALRARMTDMRAWVDSAAIAVKAVPVGRVDSMMRADTTRQSRPAVPPPPVATHASTGEVQSFREGAPAPNTASPLPLLALLGIGSLGAGAFLRARR